MANFFWFIFSLVIWQENLHALLSLEKRSWVPIGNRKKICTLYSELPEFIIHLFKEITSDIDKQCRVFRPFDGYRH